MNEKEKSQMPLNNQQKEAVKIIRDLEILAIVRTRFSSERSLMAWIRTSGSNHR